MDSKSLTEAFHSNGVNIRYLGKVARFSRILHVQDIWINEMIWRVLKILLNTQISTWILEWHNQKITSELPNFNKPPILMKQASKGILKSSNSNADIRFAKGIEKTVEFNEKLDVNKL